MNLSAAVQVNTEVMDIAAEHSAEGLVVIDKYQRLLWMNRRAERLCGLQRRIAAGKYIEHLVDPTLSKRFTPRGTRQKSRLDALLRMSRDIQLIRPDGSRRWVSVRVHAHIHSGMRVIHLLDVQSVRELEQRIQLLSVGFDQSHTALMITDAKGHIKHVNRGLRSMLGYADSELIGRNFNTLVRGSNDSLCMQSLLDRLLSGHAIKDEIKIKTNNGNVLYCEINAHPAHVFDERNRRFVFSLTDVTETHHHHRLLIILLDEIARGTPTHEVIQKLCSEVEKVLPEVNVSITRIDERNFPKKMESPLFPATDNPNKKQDSSPYAAGEIEGSDSFETNLKNLSDRAKKHTYPAISDKADHLFWSKLVINKNGRKLGTCAFHYRGPSTPDPFQQRLIDTCVDTCAIVFERDRIRRSMYQLAHHDQLTGLPNHRQVMARLDQAIAAAAHSNLPLSIFSISIDRFKKLNELIEKKPGEILLREAGKRMIGILRPSDVIGRIAEDEFAVICIPCNAQRAQQVAADLLNAIHHPQSINGMPFTPNAVIGISRYPDDGNTPEELLHHAALARLHTKRPIEKRFHFYIKNLNRIFSEKIQLENDLLKAVDCGKLTISYQPQINLYTGKIHGAEALTRWHHPEKGILSPSIFIPLAEEAGMISKIGMLVLKHACQTLKLWAKRKIEIESISINLSPTDFLDPTLPERIMGTLSDHDLRPHNLTIEITEAVLLDRHSTTLHCLKTLSKHGVKLALDDFGTGYSGFNYLRELPISEIKLDQSFINEIGSDPISRTLANAVAHIGHTTGLTVVAEGVTSSHQADLLKKMGFTAAQGFHYAEAMDRLALADWAMEKPQSLA